MVDGTADRAWTSRAGPYGLYGCRAVRVKIPTGTSVVVSPPGIVDDIRVEMEYSWRGAKRVTSEPDQVSNCVLV